MKAVVILILGTLLISLFSPMQRRYFPSTYLQMIELTHGFSVDSTFKKTALSFLGIVLVSVAVGVMSAIVVAEAPAPILAALTAALGTYVLLYGTIFRTFTGAVFYTRRSAPSILASVSLIAMNTLLGLGFGYFGRVIVILVPAVWSRTIIDAIRTQWQQNWLSILLTTGFGLPGIYGLYRTWRASGEKAAKTDRQSRYG